MEPQMVVRIMANIDGLKEALAQGGSAIQNTTAGMQRMVASFSGDKLIQQAVNMAAAIDKIGGASKLTEAELARANAVFERAAEKMTALGDTGAAAMQKLAESTRAVTPPMQQAEAATISWGQSFSSVLAGFLSAQAIWSAVTAGLNLIVSALGAVKDALVGAVLGTAALGDEMLVLANKTGISVERLSAWRYVAGQTGTSLEQITGSIFKLQAELGEGGKKTAAALDAIGLSVNQLRAQRPDEAFESVLSKLRQLPSESEKAAVGVALFGKGFKDMANLTREDIDGMMSRFQELGGTISTEMAVAGDAFNDARADWGVLVERINTSIGAAILPAATAFVNIMVDAVKKTLDESGVSAAQFQASISNAFSAVVDVSGLVLQAIGLLVQGFAELFTGKWTQETAGLVSAIGLVGTNIAGIGQAVALVNGQSGLAGMFEKLKAGFLETMRISTQVAVAGRESERVLVALGQNMASVGEQIKGKGAAALQAVQEQIRASAEVMRNAAASASSGVSLFSDAVGQMGRQIDFSDQKLQELVPRIQSVTLPLARLREGGIQATRSFADLNQTLGVEMDSAMRRATVSSQATTVAMAQLRHGEEQVTESTSEVGVAFDLAGNFVAAFGSELGILGTILNAAIGIVSNYASAVEAAGQAAGNTAKAQSIMNAAANAAATGGMMASIQIGLALKQRYDQLEAAALAVAEEMAGMNEELKEQFGSFTEAQKAAERYGLELDEVNTRFLRISAGMQRRVGYRNDNDEDRLRRFREQLDDLTDRVELARDAAERYGLTWADMTSAEDRLRAAMTAGKDLEIVFRTLIQSGFDVSAVARGMSDDINEWLNQALRAGVAIPEQMRPMLEALIRAGELSDDNARRLLGIAESGVPSLEAVTAAAQRYGIALESLGPKVQQLQIDKAAKQLIDDWNILSAATEDWGVLFESMGPTVQKLIDDAIRYGAELPAAMRPMLQAFIDAGQLVDENGNKLTDLGQLNFAEDLSAMVEQLISKLDELIQTIVGGVAPAFGGIGTSAASGFKEAGDAAATAANQMKSVFAEGFQEVENGVDELERRFVEWSEEQLTGVPVALNEIEEQIAATQKAMSQATETAEATIDQSGEQIESAMGQAQSAGTDAFEAIEEGADEAAEKARLVWQAGNSINTLFNQSDYGSPFDEGRAAAERMRREVDELINSINDIPGWSTGGSSGMADYAYRTASSDTLGPSVAYRTAPMSSSDSRIVASLDRIGRQLTNQQPDIVIVPMVTGNVDEFESRMAEAMPRRVTRSANLRNAWQRAVNGAAGG